MSIIDNISRKESAMVDYVFGAAAAVALRGSGMSLTSPESAQAAANRRHRGTGAGIADKRPPVGYVCPEPTG